MKRQGPFLIYGRSRLLGILRRACGVNVCYIEMMVWSILSFLEIVKALYSDN